MTDIPNGDRRTGWEGLLSRAAGAALTALAITGLAVTLGPFRAVVEWSLLAHTALGVALILPLLWYTVLHWQDYRAYQMSHVVLLGYVAGGALLVCIASGVVVTWQGLFGIRMSPAWRQVHLISTIVLLATGLPHAIFVLVKVWRSVIAPRRYVRHVLAGTLVTLLAVVVLPRAYSGTHYTNAFPPDYSFVYGKQRPFAPSLGRTSTGGAFDARSLAGSESCGTAGCHEQIVAEWRPSAHRYSAMDPLFQGIQNVMAKQNGAESTRYCGGCHDPISLFSGTKNIGVKELTNLHGYREGVSCLVCHGIRETDVKGNANYTLSQMPDYLWQWSDSGARRVARDFLIRTYPDEHNRLSKRLFKAPEYCAACHKQFIDQEVNQVGWVQLQNQYDNWANSHWNTKGDPRKTIECRECHMPLTDSHDPAAGDVADYNRSADDHRHRSHRFIASNALVPALLKLPGSEEQIRLTEQWLQGRREIPEISDKWARGPIVAMALDLGTPRGDGGTIPLRVILTSNKVGHDYPTGPLDIIQSWVELHVTDEQNHEVFSSGTRDARHFIAPGAAMLKAEPVDQHGNLIDRHNLWEMVGVRFRRALFPGYSDTFEYTVDCTMPRNAATMSVMRRAAQPPPAQNGGTPPQYSATSDKDLLGPRQMTIPAQKPGRYRVTAVLNYRKVDQFLLNFLLTEKPGQTAPVVEVSRASAVLEVASAGPRGAPTVRLVHEGTAAGAQ